MAASELASVTARTRRMTLRLLEETDAEEFLRVVALSEAAWRPWNPARPPDSADADVFERALERSRRGAEAGTNLRLAGFLDDGALAGFFSLNEIVRGAFQNAYAGWMVGADSMGRGLGTEGVEALLRVAFTADPDGLALHRVQANIMPTNQRSIRIAAKVGLRCEGLAVRYLEIAGTWEDHIMFAMTREEYDARR